MEEKTKIFEEVMPDGTIIRFKGPVDSTVEQRKAHAFESYFKAMGKETVASSPRLNEQERKLLEADMAKRGEVPQQATVGAWKSLDTPPQPIPSAAPPPSVVRVPPPSPAQPPSPFDIDPSIALQTAQAQQPQYGFNVGQDLITAGYGGAAGASLGTLPFVKDIALSAARQLGESFRGGDPSAVQKWTEKMRSGEYRGGKTFKEAYMLGEGRRTAPELRSPATGEKFKPTFTFAKPDIVNPSPLQQVGRTAQAMLTNPIVAKTLGGAGAGFDISEAEQRARSGDIPGAAIAATGALGSAASMFPPITAPGALVAAGSNVGLSLMDRIRNKMAQEAQYPQPEATPQELAAATIPSFTPARSGIRRSNLPPLSGPPTQPQQEAIIDRLMNDLDAQMKFFSSR